MGLLKAAGGAIGGQLGDQWKEYFCCDALDKDVLAARGEKVVNGERTSNTKGTPDVITNGSVIVVNPGQAMMIIDNGEAKDFSAEPGAFTFDGSTQPSIFYGGLGKGIIDSLKEIGKRFTAGGDVLSKQWIFYFNLKEIVGNKYGTTNPIPFRIVDKNTGLDIDAGARCNGEYSYKIVDPALFFANVCGNINEPYTRDNIDSQMRSELLTALQPVFAKLSEMGIRYSAVPAHTEEVCQLLDQELSEKWTQLRGIKIVSFGCNAISLNPEDEETIKEMQKAAALGKSPEMARGFITESTGEAMKGAATNEGGAMMGFMGMGMAQGATGNAIASMYGAGQQGATQGQPGAPVPQQGGVPAGEAPNSYPVAQDGGFASKLNVKDIWKCECGTDNTGKFCENCGKPNPGNNVPATAEQCPKCGWKPENGKTMPKFCPECGTQL